MYINDLVRPTAALLAKYPGTMPGVVKAVRLARASGECGDPELLWVDGFNWTEQLGTTLPGSPSELWEAIGTVARKFGFGQAVVPSEIGRALFGWRFCNVLGFGSTPEYFKIGTVGGEDIGLWHERFWERSILRVGDQVKFAHSGRVTEITTIVGLHYKVDGGLRIKREDVILLASQKQQQDSWEEEMH